MVDKITNPPSQKDLIDKVNELVDNIPTNYVTTDTAQDVTGQKTIIGQTILKSSEANTSITRNKNGINFQDTNNNYIGRITPTDNGVVGIVATGNISFWPGGRTTGGLTNQTGIAVAVEQDTTTTSLVPNGRTSTVFGNLGSSTAAWKNIYMYGTINRQLDAISGVLCTLTLPTQTGTLALTRDINNPTITFTQGGVTKGSFTLNQSSDQTIALDSGGGGSDVEAFTAAEVQTIWESV